MSGQIHSIPYENETRDRPSEVARVLEVSHSGVWFKQNKVVGKINNEKATTLFDSGAEVSIIYTTFDRKVGCVNDESRTQECTGLGENTYMIVGQTNIRSPWTDR